MKAYTNNKELEKYRQELARQLLSIPLAHWSSGDKEITFRCPFCGDSKKDKTKTRFNVFMAFTEDKPPVYQCFNNNCGAKGVLTVELLKDLQINNFSLMNMHNIHMSSMKKSVRKRVFMEGMKVDLTIPMPIMNEITAHKIAYFNERMGLELTGKDLLKYKIVINLYDFLQRNRIEVRTRKKYITDALDKGYFGFLSADNNYLIMRNTTNKIDNILKRYINYNVLGNEDNARKFYIMPNSVDIMRDIDIYITEGIMDIIGVYNHIMNRDDKDKIYVAACGASMESIIRHLLRLGFIHVNLHIFSDDDVKADEYRKLKKKLKGKFSGDMTVYYNKIKKDFGVRKEEINTYKILI